MKEVIVTANTNAKKLNMRQSDEDTWKESVSCIGRKIENQVPIYILNTPLSEEKPITLNSLKKGGKEPIVYQSQRTSYKEGKKIDFDINSDQKKSKKKKPNLWLTNRESEKKFLPAQTQKAKKKKMAKCSRSNSNSQIVDELKRLIKAKKQKVDIPFSTNRFQGKDKKIIPHTSRVLSKENSKEICVQKKIPKELKPDEVRSKKQKVHSMGKIILKRKKSVEGEEQKACKAKNRDYNNRIKEIGLEFVLKTKPEKLDIQKVKSKKAERIFKNDKILERMKKVPIEEKARRKNLVDKQKQEHQEAEQQKKQEAELKEQLRNKKVKEITELQKLIRDRQFKPKKAKKAKMKLKLVDKDKTKLASPQIFYKFIPSTKDLKKNIEEVKEVKEKNNEEQNALEEHEQLTVFPNHLNTPGLSEGSKDLSLDFQPLKKTEEGKHSTMKKTKDDQFGESALEHKESLKEQLVENSEFLNERKARFDNELLQKELEEKNKIILSQALNENKLHKKYQELLVKQSKDFMEKVLEATKSLQSAHDNQINSMIQKLADRIEEVANKTKVIQKGRSDSIPERIPKEDITSNTEDVTNQINSILADNIEFKKNKEREQELKNEYDKKLDSMLNEAERNEIDEWYSKELSEITMMNKRLLAEALRRAASNIEPTEKERIIVEDVIELSIRPRLNLYSESKRKEAVHNELEVLLGVTEINLEAMNVEKEVCDTNKEHTLVQKDAPVEKEVVSVEKVPKREVEEIKFEEVHNKEIDEQAKSDYIEDLKNIPNEAHNEEFKSKEDIHNEVNTINKADEEESKVKEVRKDNQQPIDINKKLKLKEKPQDVDKSDKEISIDLELGQNEFEWQLNANVKSIPEPRAVTSDEPIYNEYGQEIANLPFTPKDQQEAITETILNEVLTSICKPLFPIRANDIEFKRSERINAVNNTVEYICNDMIESAISLSNDFEQTVIDLRGDDIKKHHQSLLVNSITNQIYNELIDSLQISLFPIRHPSTDQLPKAPRGIYTALWAVGYFIDEVLDEAFKDPEGFIAQLSVPLNRDPLLILGQIQNEGPDYFEGMEPGITPPILPIELYLSLENTRKPDCIVDSPKDPQYESMLIEWTRIHDKCIFDAINDALDYYRPYELNGPPLPWSLQVKELTYRNGSTAVIQGLGFGVKNRVLRWAMTNAGMLQAERESLLSCDKSNLERMREQRLEAVLMSEVNEIEYTWVDYELEETQVILDIADMILEQLTSEVLEAFNSTSHI